jgi:hypothetical protein
MAGKIIADTIEASGSQISLNVGNVTVLTTGSTGFTNLKMAGSTSGSVTLQASAVAGTPTLTLPTTTGTLSLGLSSKVLAITRDMTLATGSVSYTGVGFRPTSLQAFGANTTLGTNNAVNGYCDSALGQAALRAGSASPGQWQYLASVLIYMGSDGAHQTFAVTSFDADGFTGTWTRTGSPGGTQSMAILCFK